MNYYIRDFEMEDYDDAYELWKHTDGIGLSSADSKDAVAYFLKHNPGLSQVAKIEEKLVGAMLCGQDGRRGYIHHLAVAKDYREQGIGRAMVEKCLQALHEQGIMKCHLFVYQSNDKGKQFWANGGWKSRDDLVIYSKDTD